MRAIPFSASPPIYLSGIPLRRKRRFARARFHLLQKPRGLTALDAGYVVLIFQERTERRIYRFEVSATQSSEVSACAQLMVSAMPGLL